MRITLLRLFLAAALLPVMADNAVAAGHHGQSSVQKEKPNFKICERPLPGQDPAGETTELLRIGVREHARPFSYKSSGKREVWNSGPPGQLARRDYTGYINRICDAVLADMMVSPAIDEKGEGNGQACENTCEPTDPMGTPLRDADVQVWDVDCLTSEQNKTYEASYNDALELYNEEKKKHKDCKKAKDCTALEKPKRQFVESRLEFLKHKIDLLCDPATISNARRHNFIISPPLFLTGIGMIGKPDNPLPQGRGAACPRKPLIGYVGSTNAGTAGLQAVLDAQELSSYRDKIVNYLNDGSNICNDKYSIGSEDKARKFITSIDNHQDAAKAFCRGDFYFYLGDRDIISFNARQITGCEFTGEARTYSDDRYAIFGRLDYENPIRALRTARFFEILSQKVVVNDSILDRAFRTTFVGTEASEKLLNFFWNIRGPE